MHTGRLVCLVVKVHLFYYRLQQTSRITFVVYGEVRHIAYPLRLISQHSREDAVKRAHIYISCLLLSHQTANSLLHLICRLIGERKSQYAPGLHAVCQEVGYFICQHTRLARPRSRYDERRSVVIQNSLPLLVIQL